jgi:multiple sugar transport system ATP-binding protein
MGDVVLQNLSKHFGKIRAVDGIDLEVKEKEFLILVGPSGCGKTTTLRMVAGLEFPTQGNILISGRLVNDIPAKDRNMAMVFQSYALYPHMTVFENMAFGLRVRKLTSSEIRQRVKEASGLMGIEDLLDRKPRQLSGGQRQRVAVCRAIVRDPEVFLFDEPLSNLDAKLRVQARGEIRKLQRRLETTSIYVTHDQTEAMTMGDRIVVMNEGKIQQVGAPLELYDKPVNSFVAGFLGSPSMNFIKGRCIREGDEILLECGDIRVPLPPFCQEGNSYLLGLRSEHIKLKNEGADNPAFSGSVELMEPLGSDSFLTVGLGHWTIIVKEEGHFRASVGENVRVFFDMDHAHLFDGNTGQRVNP